MVKSMKKIRLAYFNEVSNFGDSINPILLERIFGIQVKPGTFYDADLVAIGSMLEYFLWKTRNYFKLLYIKIKNSHPLNVYGTGLISEPYFFEPFGSPKFEMFFRNLSVSAVRGVYTKKRLEKILKKNLNDIALGDPGLLASYLIYDAMPSKKYSVGIIPHYVDKENPKILELAENIKNSKIIDIQAGPLKVLKQIAECETIISTAMHGLIVADSLGIPNYWMKVSDKIYGKDYKYSDYYSVFGLTDPEPINLMQQPVIDISPQIIFDKYKVEPSKVKQIQENLIKAFPYKK